MNRTYRSPDSQMAELRRHLVGDSIERKRWMDALVKLIREDERSATMQRLAKAREEAEMRPPRA